jgi:peptidyl-prolyl cis-trans isomerase D
MLQAMRNKMHGWPSIILLGVCVFAMSFFGMEGYLTSGNDTSVAKVGKHEISQNDMQDRLNQLRQRANAEQGDQFDTSIFEKPEMKLRVLNSMIDQQLLLKANDDLGLRVSNQAVRDYIASIPAFQVDGHFDPTSYSAVLASQRKTPEMFESEVRSDLAVQLLPDAINASTIIPAADAERFLSLRMQRRDLRYFLLPRPTTSDTKVTDEQIGAYYKAHLADYTDPERVSVKYIEVNGADLASESAPSDEELRKRYADEKQRFVQPEQRLVSHILIDVPANATPEQQKAALAKANEIAARATPEDFADLARKDSQDLGSKRQGGDLGWLEHGVTNPAFESAMLAMTKGQISKPVLTPEGYHIIWLRDIRSGDAKPFEEVRDTLVKEAAAADKDRLYNEVAGKLSDNTYQNPSSLEPASEALKLPIKETSLFSRTGGEGIAANPKVVAAAFSDDVMAQGNNSGLIDLGGDHSVVIHVDKHLPSTPRALADVRDDVRNRIIDERVAADAKAQAQTLLARLHKGDSMEEVATASKLDVSTVKDALRVQADLPPSIRDRAFLLPHPVDGKPQYAAVDMDKGVYALLAVDKVQPGDLSGVTPEQRESLRQQMAQAYGAEATSELIDVLRSRTKIKINKERL